MLDKGVLPSEVDEQDPVALLQTFFDLTDAMYEDEGENLSESDRVDLANIHPSLWELYDGGE